MDKFIRYIRDFWYGFLLLLVAVSVLGVLLMLVDCARLLTML